MPSWVIDIILFALLLGLTYALTSEGLWGSALMFFNVLFAGVIAFNFYEPLADLIAKNVSFLAGFADMLMMMVLFIVSVVVLRLTTESLAPTMVRFPVALYHIGRLGFGAAGSVVTLAIIVLAFETAPVHKKVFGVVDYKYAPPFKMGFDHMWLGFFQWTTGSIFSSSSATRDPYGEFGNTKVFDPKAEWLIEHQNKRPFGTETVPEKSGGEGGEEAAGEAAPAGAGGGGGGGGARSGEPKVIGPGPGGGVVVPN